MSRNLIIALLFATAGFVFFVLVLPQYDALLAKRTAIADVQALLKERSDLQEKAKSLTTEYQTRQADIGKLAVILPGSKQLDQIILGAQTAATESGLQLREATIGVDAQNTVPRKIGVKLGVAGTYPALLSFLETWEQSLRLYDVSEVTIAQDNSAGAAANSFAIEVKFNAYTAK